MDTAEHISLGRLGEDVAANYLREKGWLVLEKNIAGHFGEIDIICRASDGTLVFVEVKTITGSPKNEYLPEDHLTRSKLSKVNKMCQLFSAKHPELVRDDRGWRVDLIALTNNDKNVVVRHYENIAE